MTFVLCATASQSLRPFQVSLGAFSGVSGVLSVENETEEIDLLNQLQCLLFQIDSQKL